MKFSASSHGTIRPGSHAPFPLTSPALVDDLRAGEAGAPDTFYRAYWPPLYAFLRRSGSSPHDAEDLVQGFCAHLIEKNVLKALDLRKGRLRTFLIRCLKNFVALRLSPAKRRIVFV